jgi:hypothetical protein
VALSVRAQAVALVVLLAAGGVRVATYEDVPRIVPRAADVWRALVLTRSARLTLSVGSSYLARGVVEPATGRTLLHVLRAEHAPYHEVTDRSFVYLRPEPGRWYRYLRAAVDETRALDVLVQLGAADPLRYVKREPVRGLATVRYRGTLPDGRALDVWVGADGLPRQVSARRRPDSPLVTVLLGDFLAPRPIEVPLRYVPVTDAAEAFRLAGAA